MIIEIHLKDKVKRVPHMAMTSMKIYINLAKKAVNSQRRRKTFMNRNSMIMKKKVMKMIRIILGIKMTIVKTLIICMIAISVQDNLMLKIITVNNMLNKQEIGIKRTVEAKYILVIIVKKNLIQKTIRIIKKQMMLNRCIWSNVLMLLNVKNVRKNLAKITIVINMLQKRLDLSIRKNALLLYNVKIVK